MVCYTIEIELESPGLGHFRLLLPRFCLRALDGAEGLRPFSTLAGVKGWRLRSLQALGVGRVLLAILKADPKGTSYLLYADTDRLCL